MKPLHYTYHARSRLKKRGITRQQVAWMIARGVRERAPTQWGAQRWIVRGYFDRQEAAVVYVEDATHILVLTVEWLGKGGE